MLTIGLIAAAVIGVAYVWMYTDGHGPARYAMGSAIAVIGAAIPPLALGQCSFAEGASEVDKLLGLTLMAGGAWIALMVARTFWDRADGKEKPSADFAGEIRTGGFRLGTWVPWVLLSPTLGILIVFLYFPAFSTFALSTKLTRLGAPKTVDVCFTNFTELLITDPFKLVAYPLVSIALIYAARFWKQHTETDTWSRRGADVASIFAVVSVFVALYAMFSPGGGGQVAYRPVYLT